MARPILFYTKMPAGEWFEEALNFGGASGLLLGLWITIAIFITQYIGLMQTLTEGLTPLKLLIVSPVIIIFVLVISLMTFLIAGGIITGFFLLAFYILGTVLHFSLRILGGKGNFFEMVKAMFYSLGMVQAGGLLAILAILTRWHLLNFGLFVIGENIVYYGTALYTYGLWSIAGKKVHNVPRWKAFAAAVIPILLVILFNLALNRFLLPRLERWLI